MDGRALHLQKVTQAAADISQSSNNHKSMLSDVGPDSRDSMRGVQKEEKSDREGKVG